MIGRNGSGKSTVLKLIAGIYKPTSGTIEVNGRTSALLELGAGFHPEFSGRENILINGIILGLSRSEVRSRIDEIIAFSELEDVIDEPVRTYSTGMYMRLAFAVATHVNPDILIVDEILAVGDEHFAHKSMGKMMEFKELGKTIVLVTHDLEVVQRWCDAAAWIERGRIKVEAQPDEVVDQYRRAVAEEEAFEAERASSKTPKANVPPDVSVPPPTVPKTDPAELPGRRGNHRLEISAVRLIGREGLEKSEFETEEGMILEMDFLAKEKIEDVVFGVAIYRSDTLRVYGTNTLIDRITLPRPLPYRGTVRLEFGRIGFTSGHYSLDVAAHKKDGENYDYHRLMYRFVVRPTVEDIGVARPPHCWTVVNVQTRRLEAS
jgi:lipopolysaccharide transport system ATP-binding protein